MPNIKNKVKNTQADTVMRTAKEANILTIRGKVSLGKVSLGKVSLEAIIIPNVKMIVPITTNPRNCITHSIAVPVDNTLRLSTSFIFWDGYARLIFDLCCHHDKPSNHKELYINLARLQVWNNPCKLQ